MFTTGVIFPSLLQLQKGITDVVERKQQEIAARYRKKTDTEKGKLSEIDMERDEECSICMEINSKIVLPDCSHSMCMKCYRSWYALCSVFTCTQLVYSGWMLSYSSCSCFDCICRRARSQSCPFCRNSLKRVNSGDLWIYTSSNEIADLSTICRQNLKRLFMYIEKLPFISPDTHTLHWIGLFIYVHFSHQLRLCIDPQYIDDLEL